MGLKAMLFLLLAYGRLPEGSTREPQIFHCTKDYQGSTTRHNITMEVLPRNFHDITIKPPTTVQLTDVTTKQLTSTPTSSPGCAPNMVLGPSCDCERTCQDPVSCTCTGPETCVCLDGFLMNNTECVHEQDCGCYYDEGGLVVPDGATYVKEDCTERCTCSDSVLSCESAYTCSPDATCRMEDATRKCYCNDGYLGDGETCKLYTDCYDAYQAGHRQNGVFTILPNGWPGSPFDVRCDMKTSSGGWTMLQRRRYAGVFEKQTWQDYKNGFGSVSNNHWLGNEKLFYLTNQRSYKLRVDLVSSDNASTYRYQEYSLFKIANESDKFRLIELGSGNGTAGDGMIGSLGRQFSTYDDNDNDGCDNFHCAKEHGNGGWWYSDEWCNECCNNDEPTCFFQSSNCPRRCGKANLNSYYKAQDLYKKIFWTDFHDLATTEVKISPANGAVQ